MATSPSGRLSHLNALPLARNSGVVHKHAHYFSYFDSSPTKSVFIFGRSGWWTGSVNAQNGSS